VWAKGWPTDPNGEAQAYSVAVAPDGSSFVAGEFTKTVVFGPYPLQAVAWTDAFLLKLDSSGNPLRALGFGSQASDACKTVALDSSQNVWIGGSFNGSITFGSTPLTSTSTAAFVARFDKDLNFVTNKAFTAPQAVPHLAAAKDGGVVIAGSGNVNFGAGIETARGFVGKLNADATVAWSVLVVKEPAGKTCYPVYVTAVAVDKSDNALVGGQFKGTCEFPGTTLTSLGSDGFVVKLAKDGTAIWAKRVGGSDDEYVSSVAADASGNVLLGGVSGAQFMLDGCSVYGASGWYSAFIAKLDPGNACVWAKGYSPVDSNNEYSVAADSSGDVVRTGIEGTALVVAKHGAATGDLVWKGSYPGDLKHKHQGNAVAIGPNDDVYVAGAYGGTFTIGSFTMGQTSDSAATFAARFLK
jgi:hypothetical protein